MSSACEVLRDESQRFVDYIFADARLRSKIVDKRSFADALDKVLKSDPSLAEISAEISRKGESLEVCGQDIFNDPAIQDIIKKNVVSKKREISRKVKIERPSLTRIERLKETNRRLKIFITSSSARIRQTKQVSIQQALQPVKVKGYEREGKIIHSHQRTEYTPLNTQEKMLMENAIRKGKSLSDLQSDYIQARLGFRTKTSLKRHYYRLKQKLKK
jgi:hypothetical protein